MPASTSSVLTWNSRRERPPSLRQRRIANPQQTASSSCSSLASRYNSRSSSQRLPLPQTAAAIIARSSGARPSQRFCSAQSVATFIRRFGSICIDASESIVAARRTRSLPCSDGGAAPTVHAAMRVARIGGVPREAANSPTPASSGSCERAIAGSSSYRMPSRRPHDEKTMRSGINRSSKASSRMPAWGRLSARMVEIRGCRRSSSGSASATRVASSFASASGKVKACGSVSG